MNIWTSSSSVRRWLAVGVAGLLVVLALPSAWDVWQIGWAGTLLNRAIVRGADEAARAGGAGTRPAAGEGAGKSETSRDARAAITAGGDFLLTPEVQAALKQVLDLMEATASRGPHTPGREVPIWRTYGAAARMLPSDHSFELLLRSRNAGRLDWLGELWLGEVAAGTGHWEEASQVYRRVDVSNLLIYRAEAHIKAGDEELALRELTLAKVSLDAVANREKAEMVLLDRTGNEPPALEGMMQRPAERATGLSRIGRGLLDLGRPSEALPVLEQGLGLAGVSSPGVIVERNLRLDLAAAMALTVPESPPARGAGGDYSYFADQGETERLQAQIRVGSLVSQALTFERTAATCSRAGRVLLMAGDDAGGVSLLTEASRLDPLLSDPYLALGAWYEEKGLPLMAYRLYVEATELLPDDPAIAAALAISTIQTRSREEALPLLERAAGMETNDPLLFAHLGDCYVESGRMADALAAWEEGLRRSPDAELLVARIASMQAGGSAP
jgi:tetratricopeptide (TPR) repeat protein